MQKKSKDMSIDEKRKLADKAGRRIRRKSGRNIEKKSASIRTLSIKMGRYLDELRKVQEENVLLKDAVDALLIDMGLLLALPTIEKEMIQKEEDDRLAEVAKKDHAGKEVCPTCGKKFKQLSRHKCKGKKNG